MRTSAHVSQVVHNLGKKWTDCVLHQVHTVEFVVQLWICQRVMRRKRCGQQCAKHHGTRHATTHDVHYDGFLVPEGLAKANQQRRCQILLGATGLTSNCGFIF